MKKNYQTISLNPLNDKWGQQFAEEWLDAWNTHDIDRILESYAESFIMISPTVKEITGHNFGFLCGKDELKNLYFKIFEDIPDLKLNLMAIAVGIKSLTIYYSSSNYQLTVDVFEFDSKWKIYKSHAYY
jgi:hypothetical protein